MNKDIKIWSRALLYSLDCPPQEQSTRIKRFIYLLNAKRMQRKLPIILRAIKNLEEQKTVTIASSYALDQNYIQTIAPTILQTIGAPKNCIVELSIDPTLIGGIKITYQDKEYNATILNHLERLKEQLWQIS